MKSGSEVSKNRKKKKGAIGLSLEFLVIIIISIVILGFGISFLFSLLSGAEKIKTDLDQRTQQELERQLIDEGKLVALPFPHVQLHGNEEHTFGLGILNVELNSDQFTLEVEEVKVIDPANRALDININDLRGWLLYDSGPFTIKNSQHHVELIKITVPPGAQKATYIFTAKVKKGNGESYGNVQKFTVEVK